MTKKTILEELQIPVTEFFTVKIEFIARSNFEYWERRVNKEDLDALILKLQGMAAEFPPEKKVAPWVTIKEPMWGEK